MPIGGPKPQPPSRTVGPRRGIQDLYNSPRVGPALDFVEELGLVLPDKPKGPDGQPLDPRLPADITRLSNEQLGRLYGEFNAVAVYADAHLGLSDIEHTDVDYQADMTEATHGLHVEGSNRDERVFQLRTSPQVRKAREQALAKRARKVLLSKLISGYERAINALSREMSRRGMELETTK